MLCRTTAVKQERVSISRVTVGGVFATTTVLNQASHGQLTLMCQVRAVPSLKKFKSPSHNCESSHCLRYIGIRQFHINVCVNKIPVTCARAEYCSIFYVR